MSYNYKSPEYYHKFLELQEKLRKSEEERLKLEIKFNEMVQRSKEEEQQYYKRLRHQYKHFVEADRYRTERNEQILQALERIEMKISMLSAKTERFKILRHQYQTFLNRVHYNKPQGNQHTDQVGRGSPEKYTSSYLKDELMKRSNSLKLDENLSNKYSRGNNQNASNYEKQYLNSPRHPSTEGNIPLHSFSNDTHALPRNELINSAEYTGYQEDLKRVKEAQNASRYRLNKYTPFEKSGLYTPFNSFSEYDAPSKINFDPHDNNNTNNGDVREFKNTIPSVFDNTDLIQHNGEQGYKNRTPLETFEPFNSPCQNGKTFISKEETNSYASFGNPPESNENIHMIQGIEDSGTIKEQVNIPKFRHSEKINITKVDDEDSDVSDFSVENISGKEKRMKEEEVADTYSQKNTEEPVFVASQNKYDQYDSFENKTNINGHEPSPEYLENRNNITVEKSLHPNDKADNILVEPRSIESPMISAPKSRPEKDIDSEYAEMLTDRYIESNNVEENDIIPPLTVPLDSSVNQQQLSDQYQVAEEEEVTDVQYNHDDIVPTETITDEKTGDTYPNTETSNNKEGEILPSEEHPAEKMFLKEDVELSSNTECFSNDNVEETEAQIDVQLNSEDTLNIKIGLEDSQIHKEYYQEPSDKCQDVPSKTISSESQQNSQQNEVPEPQELEESVLEHEEVTMPKSKKQRDQPDQSNYNDQNAQHYSSDQYPQYDENGQPMNYDPNVQPVNYQYDEKGYPYMQQYDEKGQPYMHQQYYQNDPNYANYQQEGQQYDEQQPYEQYDQQGYQNTQQGNYDDNDQQYDPNAQYGAYYTEVQYNQNAFYQGDDTQELQQNPQHEENDEVDKKTKLMDMLETDTESNSKQENKVSNDSDFDFSNSQQ
ncbi:hypothetical protein HHI36_001587 [Cryptolaemus montrouzieri]|uniref:Centrosomal protein kizuna n=1 Tax=Cryptolaemus montrouzieri TaxID=559131 RepID=A0ABD2P8V1_9CUCU